ncbi:MAG: Npt1/Npt2 family nucleotide transporter [Myxococcota bacterium]|nr:Npt1/Npt2 family nucleotide transporter [Myxococcota bacterium]
MAVSTIKAKTTSAHPTRSETALLFLYFFFVIAAFWTLKPLKTSTVVKSIGIEFYPLVKQGLVVVVPMMVAVYSALACRLSRARLVYFFNGLFLTSNLVLWALLTHMRSSSVELVFFYHVDAYVTVMVTLFWTYLNDMYASSGARKIYGYVGAGGLIGGVMGSLISGWASELLRTHIILVSAVFMIPIFAIVFTLERTTAIKTKAAGANLAGCGHPDARTPWMQQIKDGLRTVMLSKYMMSIVAIVGLYEIVSTIVDFQFNEVTAAKFDSKDAMAGFQGKVFFIGQIVSVGVQLVLTTFIHRKCGIVHGLLFLPLALLIGSSLFIILPTLAVITAVIGSEAAFSYSINQASKEILYVPLDPVSKYGGKAFIDMFVLRAAKTLGAIILLAYIFWLKAAGIGSWFLMGIALAAVMGWLMAVRYVGSAFAKRSGCNEDTI